MKGIPAPWKASSHPASSSGTGASAALPALLLIFLTLTGVSAFGATFNVAPGSDLQATINAAGANVDASNMILFAPGVYNLGSSLTVGSKMWLSSRARSISRFA